MSGLTANEHEEKLTREVQQVKYREAVERGLEGLTAVSVGLCPGCEECADNHGYESIDEFNAAYNDGAACDEGSFSRVSCDICSTRFHGIRYTWHAIVGNYGDDLRDKPIEHFENCCVDCLMYLANGDLPESWEG